MSTSKNSAAKRIDSYHFEVWNHFHKHFDKFIKKRDDESLHQLRVSIKKIVAVVHFIEYCDSEFDAVQMKSVVKIFRLSGRLRDNRNAHLFCAKFGIQKSVLKKADSKQEDNFKKLKARHKKAGNLDLLREEMKKHLAPLNTAQLKKYLAEIMKQVIIAFQKKMSDKALHNARKKMKELTYLSKMPGNHSGEIINKSRFELLLVLEDVIGDWHDINKFRVKLENQKITKKVFDKVREKEHLLMSETLNLSSVFKKKQG